MSIGINLRDDFSYVQEHREFTKKMIIEDFMEIESLDEKYQILLGSVVDLKCHDKQNRKGVVTFIYDEFDIDVILINDDGSLNFTYQLQHFNITDIVTIFDKAIIVNEVK